MANKKSIKLRYCSFCGKNQHEVKRLIAGPNVFVCDECTALCIDLIFQAGDIDENYARNFVNNLDENSKKYLTLNNLDAIVREIEFPPEYRHAGITILSNFSAFVQDKYKDENVIFSIQQESNKIILIIKSQSGEVRERIEETLKTYGLVLAGVSPIESLTDNPYKIAEIKQQLRIAQIQLESQKELLAIEKMHSSQMLESRKSSEEQYKEMIIMMADAMAGKDRENMFLRELASSSVSTQSKTANEALKALIRILDSDTYEMSEAEVIENLKTINKSDPKVFDRISRFAESSMAGVVGNSLYSWIIPIINSIPK